MENGSIASTLARTNGDSSANIAASADHSLTTTPRLTRDGEPRKRQYKANRRAAVYQIDRSCAHCGTSFVATKNPAQKHCSPECRLWSWVQVRGRYDCWEWTGTRNCDGYGGLRINGKFYPAHRLALILQTKRDPGELFALHYCDNPPCCNPRHLRWGTAADNAADAVKRGRHKAVGMAGVSNPQARLTADELRLIVSLLPTHSNPEISARVSVGPDMISRIRNGRSWRRETKALGWRPRRAR